MIGNVKRRQLEIPLIDYIRLYFVLLSANRINHEYCKNIKEKEMENELCKQYSKLI